MKKTVIFLIIVITLSLIPFQVFAKPRVFVTFSDFIKNNKYSLYVIKPAKSQVQTSTSSRNIFVKTATSTTKKR